MSYRTCNYPKPDGVPSGSPALRDEKLCYFHHRDHERSQYSANAIRRAGVLGPRLPRMDSLADIQSALHKVMNAKVMNAIIDHRVSYRRAAAFCLTWNKPQHLCASQVRQKISHATPYG